MQNLIYRGQNFWKVPGKKIPMLHFYPKRKLHETLVVFLTLDKIQLFFFFLLEKFSSYNNDFELSSCVCHWTENTSGTLLGWNYLDEEATSLDQDQMTVTLIRYRTFATSANRLKFRYCHMFHSLADAVTFQKCTDCSKIIRFSGFLGACPIHASHVALQPWRIPFLLQV